MLAGRSPGHVARDVTSPLAICAKKCTVSGNHLPHTSAASTTQRVLPCLPDNSRYQRSFLLLASSKMTPSTSAHRPTQTLKWCPQPIGRRGTRATIGQHLNTAFIQTVGSDDFHVLDLRGDPAPSLATNTGHRLHREPAPTQIPKPQHMLHGGGRGSTGRPHRQTRLDERRGDPQTAATRERPNIGSLPTETKACRAAAAPWTWTSWNGPSMRGP